MPCNTDCVLVKGRVGSENGSATPVIGAAVKLSWSTYSPLGGVGRAIATTLTDAQGNYRFSFQPRANELEYGGFTLDFSKNGYASVDDYFTIKNRADTAIASSVHMAREGGRLRIIIKGFPANPKRDSISISSIRFRRGEPAPFPSLYATQTGKHITYSETQVTDISCNIAANQYAFIYFDKRKNGVRTFDKDSIFCPLNQYATLEYQY